MIKIGVLTSSRADYGIYLPLLKALRNDEEFDLKLIVFGTHLSKFHGYTIRQIELDGFSITESIESMLIGDTPNSIASSYALTALKFSVFWEKESSNFDFVFALGDRFEMAAAVASSIPFGIKLAHIHGGETTLGAIDNIYRHFISLTSAIHFVTTDFFELRLKMLLNDEKARVVNTGSLSLENLTSLSLLNISEFENIWNISLKVPTILVTIHPETVDYSKNLGHCEQMMEVLNVLADEFQIVITMPNADTSGMIYRESFQKIGKEKASVKIIENFGIQSYFTCMKFSKLLIGNTSSGIIEAASFKKYVLNLGDRQKGRICGDNVIHMPFDSESIIQQARKYSQLEFTGDNMYYKSSPSQTIIQSLKHYHASI